MSVKSMLLILAAAFPMVIRSHPVLEVRQDGPGHPYDCNGLAAARKAALTSQGANAQGIEAHTITIRVVDSY